MRFTQEYTPRTYFSVYLLDNKKFTEAKFGKKIKQINEQTGEEEDGLEYYEALGGYVVKLEASEKVWKGKTVKSLEIHLADTDGGHIEIITTSRYGSFARDILKKLSLLPEIGFVKLKPWVFSPEGNPALQVRMCSVSHLFEYQGVIEDADKIKCDKEVFDFPKIEPILVNGEHLQDSSGNLMWNTKERDAKVDELIILISHKLKFKNLAELKKSLQINNYKNIDNVVLEEEFDDAVPF